MNSLAQILALSGHSEGGPIFFLSLLSLFGAWSQEALRGEEGSETSGLSKPNTGQANTRPLIPLMTPGRQCRASPGVP